MRIGIDARLCDETGVGRYIRNLVAELGMIDTRNDYVLFIREKSLPDLKSQISNLKNKNIKLRSTNIHWHTLEEQIKFPQIINKEKLDLMHFPYFAVPVFYNKPYIVTIHDLIIDHFPTGKATTKHPLIYHGKRLSYKYIVRNAAKKSKKIITVSEATKTEIVKHLKVPEEKVIVTYEGVDARINSQRLPGENKIIEKSLTRNEKYFLYVGNAYPHKNLERLLLAFEQIQKSLLDTKLILVGKEDFFYKGLLNKINGLGLKDSVLLVHDISDEELAYLYKRSLAVVLPSLMEGFGLPAAEAMAAGSLLVVSDIPAFKEVCREAALYFDPIDVDELASLLKEIVEQKNSQLYLNKIISGLKRSKTFSWQKMAKETLAVYESCISL